MRVLHDTGFGVIEIYADEGLHRFKLQGQNFPPLRFVAVRTWQQYGKTNSAGEAITAKNVRCILDINKPLDVLLSELPPCIVVISLDMPSSSLRVLSDRWIRLRSAAFAKSDKLPTEKFHDFLKEYFGYAI